MKKCPACSEYIDDKTSICPFCGENVNEVNSKPHVNLRNCPICDEFIDSTMEICPICHEKTGFKKMGNSSNVARNVDIQQTKENPDKRIKNKKEKRKSKNFISSNHKEKNESTLSGIESVSREKRVNNNKKVILKSIGYISLFLIILAGIGFAYMEYINQDGTADKVLVDKQKQKLQDELSTRMIQAESIAIKGIQKLGDTYEDYLIDAYKEYDAIEKELKENEELGINLPELETRITIVKQALIEAKNELKTQSDGLLKEDEKELAEEFIHRSEKVNSFIEDNNIN